MRSLRLKLILGFLLVLAAVIAGFDIFVYAAKRQALIGALDSRLFAATQAASRHLELESGKPVFDAGEASGARPPLPRVFRIVDEKGSILGQSAGAPPFVWPAFKWGYPNPRRTTVRSARGVHWRVATWIERLETDTDNAEIKPARAEASTGLIVQCAESLSSTAHELGELTSLLALVSLAAFLIAGGGSFWLAGRALRPIRRINAALEEVSETKLDRRLDPSSFDVELHPLITRLNAALARLETGFQRERQFTADASHELRTPLAALLTTIEVLLRRPRSEAELIEACRDNEKSARSMQAVIEGLLLLARMDAGKDVPAKESVPPAALVADIFDSLAPQAGARGIRLTHSLAPTFRVQADRAQLRLALLNLIDNAVRYNRPGGLVSVEARRTDEGAVIDVRDTGVGISRDHLLRIFERFYRVDPSRSETTGGCGLGLSIVRKIIEGHGGRVGVSSGPDGSVFTIVLPDA
jgi:two-component system OmpR family sensor kinase